ncbi:hypothetical protein BD408DRAFT_428867 [Parasitella parasitica]|nr:hypothetical protein BD408DRAFT_428867 [Parasitella parasitica]
MSQIADVIADEQQTNKVGILRLPNLKLIFRADVELADQLQTFANYRLRVGIGEVPGFRFNGNDFAPAADTDYIPMSLDRVVPGTQATQVTQPTQDYGWGFLRLFHVVKTEPKTKQ